MPIAKKEKKMIKCKTIWVGRDGGNNTVALVQEIKAKNNLYFIDGWRHALDEWENRINDLKHGDICYIEEWYLHLPKDVYNKLPII